MSDGNVLAEMDCFHCYYRLRLADPDGLGEQSRYEAWLDYRQAILRRDGFRCRICGQVRAEGELKVRPLQRGEADGFDHLAPDNVACVCGSCDGSVAMTGGPRRAGRPG